MASWQEFLWQVASTLTPPAIIGSLLLSLVVTGLIRLVLPVFKAMPASERRYWISVGLLGFALLLAARFVLGGAPTRPLIRATIDAFTATADRDAPRTVNAFLIVSVRNSGMPTVLEEWEFSVVPAGGSALKGRSQHIPRTLRLQAVDSGMEFTQQDALADKTAERPIPSGGLVKGILWFKFEGADEAVFRQPSTRLTVRMKDVLGTEHRAEKVLFGRVRSLEYIPGVGQPIPGTPRND